MKLTVIPFSVHRSSVRRWRLIRLWSALWWQRATSSWGWRGLTLQPCVLTWPAWTHSGPNYSHASQWCKRSYTRYCLTSEPKTKSCVNTVQLLDLVTVVYGNCFSRETRHNNLFHYIVHYFWLELYGPWSNFAPYEGNRLPFGMQFRYCRKPAYLVWANRISVWLLLFCFTLIQ